MKKTTVNGIGIFDLCKGVAILATILFHIRDHWFFPSIPLLNNLIIISDATIFFATNEAFFMMAGYSMRKRPVKKMFSMQFKQTMVPYLTVTGVISVVMIVTQAFFTRRLDLIWLNIFQKIGGYLLGTGSGQKLFGFYFFDINASWFILAFFWAGFILNVVLNYVPEKLMLPVFLVLYFLGNALARDWSYFCLMAGAANAIFYYIGYTAKKKKWLEHDLTKWLAIFLVAALAVTVLEGHDYFFRLLKALHVSQNWMPMAHHSLGSVFRLFRSILWAFIFIIVFVKLSSVNSRIVDAVSEVGRHSMDVYFVHAVDYSVLNWWGFSAGLRAHPVLGFLVEAVVRGCLIALACMAVNYYKQYKRDLKYGAPGSMSKSIAVGGIGMFDLCKGAAIVALILYNIRRHWDFGDFYAVGDIVDFANATVFLASAEAIFLIAGYNLRQRSTKKMAAAQFKQMVVPYLLSSLCAVVLFFAGHQFVFRGITNPLNGAISRGVGMMLGLTDLMTVSGHSLYGGQLYWFAFAFFWAVFLYNLITSRLPQKYILPVMVVLFFLSFNVSDRLPFFGFVAGAGYALYIFVGKWAKKNHFMQQDLIKHFIILCGLALTVSCINWLAESVGYLSSSAAPHLVVSIVNRLRMTVSFLVEHLLWATAMVLLFVNLSGVKSKLIEKLSMVGRHSIDIFFIHVVENTALPWRTFSGYFKGQELLGFFTEILLRAVLIAFACAVIVNCRRWIRGRKVMVEVVKS